MRVKWFRFSKKDQITLTGFGGSPKPDPPNHKQGDLVLY